MNYYERYCGDYARDTAHLSLVEHGAYTMMLDTYYATERPLPAALDLLYRICRAMQKHEQAAVTKIATEFFPVGPDGMRRNARADREIAAAQPRIAAARANGKRGGRHKKTQPQPTGNPVGFQQEPNGQPRTNPEETQPGEALRHTPSTTLKPKPKNTSANPIGFAAFWAAYPNKKNKAAALKTWIKLKPEQELIDRIMVAVTAAKQSDDWVQEGGQYIPHPTTWLHGERWEDELRAANTGKSADDWWKSEAATLAKQQELGLSSRGGESWKDLRERIRQRLNETQP